jgi:hypothetical protein
MAVMGMAEKNPAAETCATESWLFSTVEKRRTRPLPTS